MKVRYPATILLASFLLAPPAVAHGNPNHEWAVEQAAIDTPTKSFDATFFDAGFNDERVELEFGIQDPSRGVWFSAPGPGPSSRQPVAVGTWSVFVSPNDVTKLIGDVIRDIR